jgi:biofilm PGA synthesis N-glycosyltransferase PgaC
MGVGTRSVVLDAAEVGRKTNSWLAVLTAAAAGGHVLYPTSLGILSLVQRRRVPGDEAPCAPPLSVVVPAYRERGTIAHKVADLRNHGYGGPIEIVVVTEDDETARAAAEAGARVLCSEERLGKSQAVNLGIAAARYGVVVVTDANNDLVPGSLEALARPFSDPTVGGVAGSKTEDGDGEAAYWRFESWLKQRESDLGTTLGMVGELFAVRRAAWRPIPLDVGSDDLWTALDLAERGYRVRFEPSARSVERSAAPPDQWERRLRISAMALHVFWRKAHLLHPRNGLVAFEILGHKLWRSTLGPLAHVVLVAVSLRTWRTNAASRVVLALHLGGASALVLQRRGARLPRLAVAGAQVLYLQLVAIAGLVRFARGHHSPVWAKPPR